MKNLRKKILGVLIVIGLGRCVFSPQGMMPNTVHATDESSTSNTLGVDKISFLEIIDLILKIIYVLLWPLLVLAGMALDNSMVYGSFLHMDAPLWQFWNMTKNFANFALGFMVLIAILKSIFTLSGTKGPMEVIKKTLIAGILIQASWFLMAALIDVSTIATYAIGGMPMSILKTSKTINDKKLLMTESSLDLNNVEKIKENDFEVRYKTYTTGPTKKEILLSPCATQDLNGETYIIGRKYGALNFKNDINEMREGDQKIRDTTRPTRNICILGQKPYFFNEFPNTRSAMTPEAYESTLKDNINQLGDQAQQLEKCKFIININQTEGNSSSEACSSVITALISNSTVTDPARAILQGFNNTLIPQAIDNTQYGYSSGWLNTTAATTIGEIIDKSKGFVGPLVTIYASLMDFASLPDTAINNVSITKGIGDFLFRTGVAIGLFFPLLALAIVLIARIGFLRGIIAASPLVVLAEVFKIDILKKQINIANVIKTIFAPVITVFALSISLIFMTTLSEMLSFNNIEKIDVLRNMQIEKTVEANYDTYDIIGQKIQLPKSVGMYVGATGDVFSWMIVSFCGIGMMWFILFAAIKASGTIGESIGKSVETFGSNFMKTVPIIPTPLGNAGLGTLKDKFSESNAQNYRENNVVKLPQQKQNMDAYLESKAPQFFKGDKFGKDESFSENPIETEKIARLLASGNIEGARNYATKEQGLSANSLADPTNINAIKAFGEKNLSIEERKTMLNSLDQTSGGSESINTIKSSVVTAADKDAANKLLDQMKSEGKINPDNITNEFVITLKDKKEYTYNKDKNALELKATTPPSTN